MEDIIKLFRESLLSALRGWIETNREGIGEKWYSWFLNKMGDASDCDTAIKIMGTAMWAFSMIADMGVLAGIGPDGASIHEIREGLDEKSTRRLLMVISSCMNLQHLPQDLINKPIPIISTKQFSLKLFTERHG